MTTRVIMGGSSGSQIVGMNDLSLLGGDDLASIMAGDFEIEGDDFDSGDDSDSGYDEEAQMGANRSGKNKRRQRMLRAARAALATRVAARNAVMVKQVEPTNARVFPMGFESPFAIPSGDSVLIIGRPQVIFRPEYLRVPSDIAGDFAIDDIKVGKDSQFVAPGPIPARLLQENAIGSRMQMDTAQISQEITVAVTNRSGADRIFAAGMWGNAVE